MEVIIGLESHCLGAITVATERDKQPRQMRKPLGRRFWETVSGFPSLITKEKGPSLGEGEGGRHLFR